MQRMESILPGRPTECDRRPCYQETGDYQLQMCDSTQSAMLTKQTRFDGSWLSVWNKIGRYK